MRSRQLGLFFKEPTMSTNSAKQSTLSGVVALSLPDVIRKTALGRSSLYALMLAGQFPKPAKVGRRSIFNAAEVDAWLEARFAARAAGGAE